MVSCTIVYLFRRQFSIIYAKLNNCEYYIAQDKIRTKSKSFQAGPFSSEGKPLPQGTYYLDIGTPLTEFQPESVQKVFGKDGINLKGSLVSDAAFSGKVVNYGKTIPIGERDYCTNIVKGWKEVYNGYSQLYSDLMEELKYRESGGGDSLSKDAKFAEFLREKYNPNVKRLRDRVEDGSPSSIAGSLRAAGSALSVLPVYNITDENGVISNEKQGLFEDTKKLFWEYMTEAKGKLKELGTIK